MNLDNELLDDISMFGLKSSSISNPLIIFPEFDFTTQLLVPYHLSLVVTTAASKNKSMLFRTKTQF